MKYQLRAITILAIFFLSAISSSAITDEREFTVINAANGLADNSAQVVVCTKTGRMIISTIGNLNFYDGSSFTHIDTNEDLQYQLPLYHGNYHLYFDRYHHIWLKNKGTVTCVDLYMERFVEDVDSVVNNVFEVQEPVLDLFVDSIGDVWFLTQKGLYGARQKRTYHVLSDCNLQDLDIYNNSMLVTFYDNGEEEGIDLTTGRVLHRTKAYHAGEAEQYRKSSLILRYKDGFFQIRNGSSGGILMYFDLKQLRWTKVMEQNYHLNSLAINNGKLYMASEYGYWVYDLEMGEKLQVSLLQMIGSEKQLETSTNCVSFDRQGGMWIGTEKRGLLYAHPKVSPFKTYYWDHPTARKYSAMLEDIEEYVGDFKGMKTNCKLKDSRDWTWFGTSVGLYLYRTPQSEPLIFTKQRGLLNNVIHSIVEDRSHNIWVSTSYGISCIIFEDDKPVFVNSFNDADNVPNESFLNGKARCLDDGMVIMQSIDHIVTFYPETFTTNRQAAFRMYPKLVRLLVNGSFVNPGEETDGNVIIDRAITRAKTISLNADQNSISLTFSGLNYFRPVQTFYRVKVKGLQDEWRMLSPYDSDGMVDRNGMLHLPLIGLKPGTYEVAVQASLYPYDWPEEEEAFVWVINVNQPWWRSTGVYLFLGTLVLVMLLVNFYFYNRNSKMRIRLNAREGDMIRKISAFTSRCDMYLTSPLSFDSSLGGDENESNLPSKEFIAVMSKLMPYVREHRADQMSMHELGAMAGVEVAELYEVLSDQLYKNPRSIALHLQLEKAAHLLRTTKKPIEEIADECGFGTPNYFMGSFFHQYKVIPLEYRKENS